MLISDIWTYVKKANIKVLYWKIVYINFFFFMDTTLCHIIGISLFNISMDNIKKN